LNSSANDDILLLQKEFVTRWLYCCCRCIWDYLHLSTNGIGSGVLWRSTYTGLSFFPSLFFYYPIGTKEGMVIIIMLLSYIHWRAFAGITRYHIPPIEHYPPSAGQISLELFTPTSPLRVGEVRQAGFCAFFFLCSFLGEEAEFVENRISTIPRRLDCCVSTVERIFCSCLQSFFGEAEG